MADDDQTSLPYRIGAALRTGAQAVKDYNDRFVSEAIRPYREFGAGLTGAAALPVMAPAAPSAPATGAPTPAAASPTTWDRNAMTAEDELSRGNRLPVLPQRNLNAVAGYGDRAIANAQIPSTEEMQAAEAARNVAMEQARVDAQSRNLVRLGLSPEEVNQRGVPGLNASNYHPVAGGPAVELDYGPNQRIFGSGVGSRGQPNTFVGAGLPTLSSGIPGGGSGRMTDVITGQLEAVKNRIAMLTGSGNFRDIRTRVQLEKQQDKLLAQLTAHGQIEHAASQLGETKEGRLQTGRQNAAQIAMHVPAYIDALTALHMLTPQQRAEYENARRGGAQYGNIPGSPFPSVFFNRFTGQYEPGIPGVGAYGVSGY